MSSKWITIIEGCAFFFTAAVYFLVACKSKDTKSSKWAQILLIYANIGVFWATKRLSTVLFFVFVGLVILFNLNKAKRNERRNKRLIT